MNSRLKLLFGIGLTLLTVPLIAMQFTNEVNWGVFDFIIAGILIFGLIFLIEMIIRKSKSINYRFAMIAGSVLLFLIIWLELAVGILGSPFAGS